MNKENYKKIFLTIFIATLFYSVETTNASDILNASSESLQINQRKGLPWEMVMTADELREKQLKNVSNFVLFDARDERSYEESHIQGAVLPLATGYYQQKKLYKKGISDRSPNPDMALKENMKKYAKNTPIVTYCSSGGCQASAVLALQIKRLGFTNVKAMEDGIERWDDKGYPMESNTKIPGFSGFSVYSEASSLTNHYSPSGFMGDYADIKFDGRYTQNPHSGATCIRIVYSPGASQGARWAGIFWQDPVNNWGAKVGGYNLTGASKLTFWVRGEKGGEQIEQFKAGGMTGGKYADTDMASLGPIVLTDQWRMHTIDLGGKNLSSISGGFSWATNLDINRDGMTFYLDDIRYE